MSNLCPECSYPMDKVPIKDKIKKTAEKYECGLCGHIHTVDDKYEHARSCQIKEEGNYLKE